MTMKKTTATTETTATVKTITEGALAPTFSLGTQDVVATRHMIVNGHKVRLTIRSDSHAHQSYAHAEVWSEPLLQWHEVFTIHFGSMKTPTELYYRVARGADRKSVESLAPHFTADFQTMGQAVIAILAGV